MKFDNAIEEGFKEQIGGIMLAVGILLTSFGIQRQNDTLRIAQEFLDQYPAYIQQLENLRSIDRFDKVTRNKVANQWKAFISEHNLDSRLSRGLKTAGEGQLAGYNK